MLSALLTQFWPYLAAAAGALVAIFAVYKKGEKSGKDGMKVKEAEARAKNIEDIKRSQRAADAVKPSAADELSDPNNRDNWK